MVKRIIQKALPYFLVVGYAWGCSIMYTTKTEIKINKHDKKGGIQTDSTRNDNTEKKKCIKN